MPANIDLVGAEIEMLEHNEREKNLKNVLSKVAGDFDYIFIDCSPSLGLLTVNALTAADSVIIPVQCEYFALEGLGKLLNTIKIIQGNLNRELEIEGFLLTMYDSRLRLSNQVAEEVNKHFQQMVFKTIIQRNIKLSEAPSFGQPAILYDADSRGTVNYLNLAKELIAKHERNTLGVDA
jgi:chromosome partitioning protein